MQTRVNFFQLIVLIFFFGAGLLLAENQEWIHFGAPPEVECLCEEASDPPIYFCRQGELGQKTIDELRAWGMPVIETCDYPKPWLDLTHEGYWEVDNAYLNIVRDPDSIRRVSTDNAYAGRMKPHYGR